jgi:hypothetical protein
MSSSYETYKKRREAREIAKENISHKNNNRFFSNLKLFIISATALLLAGFAAFNLYLSSLPPIANLEDFKPNIVTKFYSHDGEVIKTFTAYTYDRVELKDVPEDLKKALIATEDKNFYKHKGYDILGIVRSSIQNVIARHAVQGASTLTQQLARILFLSNERTLTRKIKEIEVEINDTINNNEGVLGCEMNNENFVQAQNKLLHVIKVNENSFAKDSLYLIENQDYIIGIKTMNDGKYYSINDDKLDNLISGFIDILKRNKGKECEFYIFNIKRGIKIILTKIPTDDDFSLGCDVAYGRVHEFPKFNEELDEEKKTLK